MSHLNLGLTLGNFLTSIWPGEVVIYLLIEPEDSKETLKLLPLCLVSPYDRKSKRPCFPTTLWPLLTSKVN